MNQHELRRRCLALSLILPPVKAPTACYVASKSCGNLLVIAGQISQENGEPAHFGHLGATLGVAEGKTAARSAALSLLAQIDAVLADPTMRVASILRLGVFIASTAEFSGHSQVADGASQLLIEVLGEAGRHARTAVGVASLPVGVAIEIDALIELRHVA